MFFTNKAYTLVINTSIVEYDIKSANTSVMEYYKMIPQPKIDMIKEMSKQERVVKIGKMMRKDLTFSKQLESSFNDILIEFMKANNLDKDDDIISIKRDAAFVLNKVPKVVDFGSSVHFIPKNSYTSYVYINGYEIYYNLNHIDVKGISDEVISSREIGMLDFFKEFFEIAEGSNYSIPELSSYMKEFVSLYKNRELDKSYYREFNNEALYRLRVDDRVVLLKSIKDTHVDEIDISYNYINIILPLIRELI